MGLKTLSREDFEAIRERVKSAPESGPVSYNLYPKTCQMNFKAPEGVEAKDISWSRDFASYILATGTIIAKLMDEVEAHAAEVAELVDGVEEQEWS